MKKYLLKTKEEIREDVIKEMQSYNSQFLNDEDFINHRVDERYEQHQKKIKLLTNDGNIEVGTLLTYGCGTDDYPYEVVKVIDQHHIFVRELGVKASEDAKPYSNKWDYFSDKTKQVKELKFRYNEWRWVIRDTQGKVVKYESANIYFGFARYYYDYEF